MPPKATSLETKLDAFHQHFLRGATCFTLKELEAKPPGGAAKIRAAEVKSLLKNLTDEGQVKCEKIGAGNWYWAPWNNQAAEKQKSIQDLTVDKNKREASISAMQKIISGEEKRLPDLNGLLERASEIQVELREARGEHLALQEKLRSMGGDDLLLSTKEKQKELKSLAADLERWEDNMELVKSYILRLLGGDRSALNEMLCSLSGEVRDQDYEGNEDEGEDEIDAEPPAKRVKTA